jgi:hypothetical protein
MRTFMHCTHLSLGLSSECRHAQNKHAASSSSVSTSASSQSLNWTSLSDSLNESLFTFFFYLKVVFPLNKQRLSLLRTRPSSFASIATAACMGKHLRNEHKYLLVVQLNPFHCISLENSYRRRKVFWLFRESIPRLLTPPTAAIIATSRLVTDGIWTGNYFMVKRVSIKITSQTTP